MPRNGTPRQWREVLDAFDRSDVCQARRFAPQRTGHTVSVSATLPRRHDPPRSAAKKEAEAPPSGLGWDDERWNFRFQELQTFVAEKGHARVPYDYADHPPLSSWVYQQRKTLREGRLSEDRRRRLDEVGPGWQVKA